VDSFRPAGTVYRETEIERMDFEAIVTDFLTAQFNGPVRVIAFNTLEQGRLPIEEIARETGFGDRERMRRSFLRTFGATPQALRNAAHPLATI
jgi:hypothetical protein